MSLLLLAGLIMAIAFAGLIMSHELVVKQIGFMLCFSVLLDTFLVRTLLVPAIVILAGAKECFIFYFQQVRCR